MTSNPVFEPVNPAAPDEDLSVGIPEIDAEHRRFFMDIHDLDNALKNRRHIVEIQDMMTILVENALAHFAHEEKLFAQFGFPALADHARIHEKIAAELLHLKQVFHTKSFSDKWLETGAALKDILLNHILHDDMQYRDFLYQYRLLPTG